MKRLSFPYLRILLAAAILLPAANASAQFKVRKDSSVTRFFQREAGLIAGDGGFSVPLTNGKVLWLMGDSHIDDYDKSSATVPCLFQVRNTAVIQPKGDWQWPHTETLTGNYPGIKSYLKNQAADSLFCWPGAGIQLGDFIYIYCGSLKNAGTGAFGFAASGNDFFAKIPVKDLSQKEYKPLPSFNGINFGIGFIRRNNYIYAYGQQYTPSAIMCSLYLGRFSVSTPFENWEYWNGKGWSKDVAAAAVIASQQGVSGTFHLSEINGKILLLSSELSINCDSGTEIYTATAAQLTGPFSDKKMLYAIDDRKEGHRPFFYAAIAHPEYINRQNELLVTYAINGYGTCVTDCINNRMDPDVYRLKGLRIPLDLLK
jgi:hypothetical protein